MIIELLVYKSYYQLDLQNYIKNQTNSNMYNQPYFIEDYTIQSIIGYGGQATVYLCSKGKELCAAKVYQPFKQSSIRHFKKEVQFLQMLHHDNFVNIIGSKIDAKVKLPDFNEEGAIETPVIFTQFAQRMTITPYIQQGGPLPEKICRSLIKNLIQSIKFLHQKNICHRDIKLDNILFDRYFNIKISDFGLSRDCQDKQGNKILYSKVGTSCYQAPQINLGKYEGVKVDIFAIGVVLFYMFSGQVPFSGTNNTNPVYKHICQKKYQKFWDVHQKKKPQGFFPQPLKRLFQSFFSKTVSERPTYQSLAENEWLAGPQASKQQIVKQLQSRYFEIIKINKQQLKIQSIISSYQLPQLEPEKKTRSGGQQEEQQLYFEDQYYDSSSVDTESLPLSRKFNLVDVDKNAHQLVNCIIGFIKMAQHKGQVWTKCFDAQASLIPKKYDAGLKTQEFIIWIKLLMEYKVQLINQVDLKQQQQIPKQAQQKLPEYEQLYFEGQLVCLPDESVSIDWQPETSNYFPQQPSENKKQSNPKLGNRKGDQIWIELIIYDITKFMRTLQG